MGITKKSSFATARQQISVGFFSMWMSAAALKHKYINVSQRELGFLLLRGVLKTVCYKLRMCERM